MPTIKVTSEGKIILKDGKPSCTCCGPCSPDVMTVYVEYIDDPLGAAEVTYFEMTGSLNAGSFTGLGGNGIMTLIRDVSNLWYLTDPVYGEAGATIAGGACFPEGEYIDADGVENSFWATVSFTPLP